MLLLLLLLVCFEIVLLCSPGWPQTWHPPRSVSPLSIGITGICHYAWLLAEIRINFSQVGVCLSRNEGKLVPKHWIKGEEKKNHDLGGESSCSFGYILGLCFGLGSSYCTDPVT